MMENSGIMMVKIGYLRTCIQSGDVVFAREFFADQGKNTRPYWRKARIFDAEMRKNHRKTGIPSG